MATATVPIPVMMANCGRIRGQMKVVVVCVNLRDVSDHDNRLTVTGPAHHFALVDVDKNINKVSYHRIDDPSRLRQLIVPTPINVVPAIFLCAVRGQKELLIRRSTIVQRDSPLVIA